MRLITTCLQFVAVDAGCASGKLVLYNGDPGFAQVMTYQYQAVIQQHIHINGFNIPGIFRGTGELQQFGDHGLNAVHLLVDQANFSFYGRACLPSTSRNTSRFPWITAAGLLISCATLA